MYLKSLSLVNFRNLKKASLIFNPHYNFLIGANTQGKTNVLEAIYYLTCARSFRVSKINNLIRVKKEYFYLKGTALKGQKEESLEVSFKEGVGRKHKYNKVLLKKGEYPWGIVPTLGFSRKDLKLSEEEAYYRRRFLDSEISFLSKPYFSHLKRYNRCLKQRNIALKRSNKNDENVWLWDTELAAHAAFLVEQRHEFVELLNVLARLIYRQLTKNNEEMQVRYRSQVKIDGQSDLAAEYLKLLRASREKERKVRHTLVGPHRDDFEIIVNNQDIRKFGSSGQHKSVVISIKLALIEMVKKRTGDYPVLLLDEVFSELDKDHCVALLEILKKKKMQVFFTANHLPPSLENYFLGKTTIFTVSGGEVLTTPSGK